MEQTAATLAAAAALGSFNRLEACMSSDASTLLTIFLKHDQSNNLDMIQSKLKASQWWDRFPPDGVEVVSWTVAMGFGQIVTLRVPVELIPVVNVELERSAWGVFTTECFPTYDFVPVRQRIKERVENGGQ